MDTFFEGPEKKVEVVLRAGQAPLRERPDGFWADLVKRANAAILSSVETSAAKAYLLSESSLFVFDDRITMITCGQTTLADAALHLINDVGTGAIAMLMYERKNEHMPHQQHSTFFEDAARLAAAVPGKSLQFGAEHSHCIRLFHSSCSFEPPARDATLEVLMHGLPEHVARAFNKPQGVPLGLERLLPGFLVDGFAFEPAGYSLNAIRDDEYYTFHVTPERFGSYVSFETNAAECANAQAMAAQVIEIFQPRAFDILAFAPGGRVEGFDTPGYHTVQNVSDSVCGYGVRFQHHWRSDRDETQALTLTT